MTPADPGRLVRARALELGFDAVGIARVEPLEAVRHYQDWLAAGRHGTMAWIASASHRERRAEPGRVLPGVRSVVSVALCHEPAADPQRDRRLGRIARYAVGEDYHRVMKDKLAALEGFVRTEALPGSRALWYSDTGAILERAWAERAGLGWIGKHSALISETLGSWFLLGEVLVDRDLEPDPPPEAAPRAVAGRVAARCGACQRCLIACPTGALVAPCQLDARRCVSYLTIELRGPIPLELRALVGEWVFGCDVCQEVCPWNRFAPPAREARLHARALEGWTLERLLALDEASFLSLFATSPIRRARRGGLLRNVCVALGNRADATAAPALRRSLESDPEPLVRAHAAWALGEIARRCASKTATDLSAVLGRAARNDPDEEARGEAAAARDRLSR